MHARRFGSSGEGTIVPPPGAGRHPETTRDPALVRNGRTQRSLMESTSTALSIAVVSGIGRANTLLSAFDDALRDCGVYDYNLIPLSSVVPPRSAVRQQERYDPPPEEYGHRLYIVKAEMRSDHAGKTIAAGLGWYQWGDGRGVFVEHETTGSTRAAAESEMTFRIRESVRDLCAARGVTFREEDLRTLVVQAEVTDRPTCVLALAVFKAEPWW